MQEEKERKKLAAKLPKVEAELEEQILLWEKENGRQFQVCGVRYMEYVNTQRETHEIEKQLVFERAWKVCSGSDSCEHGFLGGSTSKVIQSHAPTGNTTYCYTHFVGQAGLTTIVLFIL